MSSEGRYRTVGRLGEGGMGAVDAVVDARLGRTIAVKRIRTELASTPRHIERFVREAKVQGQLEHPAVVPVYDLSEGDDGVFFSMRQVEGQTLTEWVAGAAPKSPGQLTERLTVFLQVSLAVEYAHAQGILHRDIKPDNVMLGKFGEVYLLDWGLAFDRSEVGGGVAGTPGYMAPEQILRPPDALDGRADVFSLGAVLFFVMSGGDLIAADANVDRVLEATCRGADVQSRLRALGVESPPELVGVCARATATDRADRTASARMLHDAVAAFVQGDRDAALRRELAARQIDAARTLAGAALDSDSSMADRHQAIRAMGRVMALDPTNAECLEWMARLLVQPSPAAHEALSALRRDDQASVDRLNAKSGLWTVLALAAFFCASLLILGVRQWSTFALIVGSLVMVAFNNLIAMRSAAPTRVQSFVSMTGVVLACVGVTQMFGPLVFVPAMMVLAAAAFAVSPDRVRRFAFLVVAIVVMVVPFVTSALGWTAAPYAFVDGGLLIRPVAHGLDRLPTLGVLFVGQALAIFAAARTTGRVADASHQAKAELELYTAQLTALLPADTAARARGQSGVLAGPR